MSDLAEYWNDHKEYKHSIRDKYLKAWKVLEGLEE